MGENLCRRAAVLAARIIRERVGTPDGARLLLLEDQEDRVNDGARARYIPRGTYGELRGGNYVNGTGKIVRVGREIPCGPEAP